MFNFIFNIYYNFNIEDYILVIISLLFIFKQNKKKGDKPSSNLNVGNVFVNIHPTIKLFNFNINSKNRSNIKKS